MTATVSIQSLVDGVQRALTALAPTAESIGVPWRAPDAYDTWDEAAQGVFNGFVGTAIRESVNASGCLPINRYDVHADDFSQLSSIAVLTEHGPMPFIGFDTAARPFDTCVIAYLGADLRVKSISRLPFIDTRFVLLARYTDQPDQVFETLVF